MIKDNNNTIPLCFSGEAAEIYRKQVVPVLECSRTYKRATAYYNPGTIILLLNQFEKIWQKNGKIELIIDFKESLKILPNIYTPEEFWHRYKRAIFADVLAEIRRYAGLGQIDKDYLPYLFSTGKIDVRLVTPRINRELLCNKVPVSHDYAIFHSKFSIFEELEDSVYAKFVSRSQYFQESCNSQKFIAISGSFNESISGLTKNSEDSFVFRSWVSDEQERANFIRNRFDEIWNDEAKDLIQVPFTEEFLQLITEVEHKIKNKKICTTGSLDYETSDSLITNNIFNYLRKSLVYYPYTISKIRPLPHQARVFRNMLCKTPIRGIIADEVGLGKTIEAGLLLSYINKIKDKKSNIVILVPASLRNQWQKELFELFDLDFFIYDHSNKKLISKSEVSSEDVFESKKNMIISWHWLRSIKNENKLRNMFESTEMVFVDEAHHARIMRDNNKVEPTEFSKLLHMIKPYVRNLCFLTATPIQTDITDMFSLLFLCGPKEPIIKNDELEWYSRWSSGQLTRGKQTLDKITKDIAKWKSEFEVIGVPFSIINKNTRPLSLDEEYIKIHPIN